MKTECSKSSAFVNRFLILSNLKSCAFKSVQLWTKSFFYICSEDDDKFQLLRPSVHKIPAVSSSLSVLVLNWQLLCAGGCLVVRPWAVSGHLTSRHRFFGTFPEHLQLSFNLTACVEVYSLSPSWGLPDPAITFDRAHCRLGVWRQRAPGGRGAMS